jgi:hypothetical protein
MSANKKCFLCIRIYHSIINLPDSFLFCIIIMNRTRVKQKNQFTLKIRGIRCPVRKLSTAELENFWFYYSEGLKINYRFFANTRHFCEVRMYR